MAVRAEEKRAEITCKLQEQVLLSKTLTEERSRVKRALDAARYYQHHKSYLDSLQQQTQTQL